MFQYATGRAVAHRFGCELLLDVSSYDKCVERNYELGEWCIHANTATEEDIARVLNFKCSSSLLGSLCKLLRVKQQKRVFKEKSFAYSDEILKVVPPVYLDGYWQSEFYFSSIANILRNDFILKTSFDTNNQCMINKIKESEFNSVSLHIRRGDYVSNPQAANYHGVCSLSYYSSAVKYVTDRVTDPHFFIFSDDPEWVRENLKISHRVTLVDINGPGRGVWDMALMMNCRHHVIANSSFSWWGAWLNPNSEKIVVAPKVWFTGASHDTSDLIPHSWVRL